MKKKIKIILACLLSTSCLSAVSPANFSLLTTKAYAEVSTYSLSDNGEFKSLDVQSTDGQSLEFCDDYGGHKKNLTDDKDYYVLLDGNSDGVKIFGEVEGDGYIAKVFESDRNIATPHDMGENISLEKGQTTLYIRTYTSEDALKRAVDNQDITNCSKTYKIYINKSLANGADEVGLETLTLDSGKVPISFNRDTLSYNISVDKDQEDVQIRARPEDNKYNVKINSFTVDEDNKYNKDLHLQYGLNEIKIVVSDLDDRIRIYTLNITRGNMANVNASSGASTSKINSSSNVPKINQWIQIGGKWEYNDSTGNSLKNIWYYDRNYGKNYYLKEDGTMATGWLSNNEKWYYLGSDGAMKTGWQLINGIWYYLDSQGVMAYNTKVDGYKLASDGAWTR
jgi:glucan-binding YG repeat protein